MLSFEYENNTLISGRADEPIRVLAIVPPSDECRVATIFAPGAQIPSIMVVTTGCTTTGHMATPFMLSVGNVRRANLNIHLRGSAPPVALSAIGFDETYPDMSNAVSHIDGGTFSIIYDETEETSVADIGLMRANGTINAECIEITPVRNEQNTSYIPKPRSCTIITQDYQKSVFANATGTLTPNIIDLAALTGVFGEGTEKLFLQVKQSTSMHGPLIASIIFTCTAAGVIIV